MRALLLRSSVGSNWDGLDYLGHAEDVRTGQNKVLVEREQQQDSQTSTWTSLLPFAVVTSSGQLLKRTLNLFSTFKLQVTNVAM